jgi:hypothetical protein
MTSFEEISLTHRLEILKNFERRYRGGELTALLYALDLCLRYRIDVPDWVQKEIHTAVARSFMGDLKSWNQVFGRPRTRGQYERLTRDVKMRSKINQAISLHDGPMDNLFYEELGERLGIGGKSKVKALHYSRWRLQKKS